MPRVVVGLVLAITTLLWGTGRWTEPGLAEGLWPWRAEAQLTALWVLALTSLALLVGMRTRALEPVFGGLDEAVRLHRRLGGAALLISALHVLLLIPPRIGVEGGVAEILDPFASPFWRDVTGAWLLLPLGLAAVWRRLPHHLWLLVHRAMAVMLLGLCLHAVTMSETIRAHEPLRFWSLALLLIGVFAPAWRLLLFRRLGARARYAVASVTPRGAGVVDLALRPVDRRLTFDPGAFAYLSVRGSEAVPPELHPFSIASSPAERELRFSIRQAGDWTRRLDGLAPGTAVEVHGPFGGFTLNAMVGHRRVVMIGAGIGITPFLSMLRFEGVNDEFRRLWLYYLVRTEEDAVHHEELTRLATAADSWVDYRLWVSSREGRLTALAAGAEAAALGDHAVMLCGGPAFLRDMRRQFRALSLPPGRIVAEEFDFRG